MVIRASRFREMAHHGWPALAALFALAWAELAGSASAQGLSPIPYDDLRAPPARIIDWAEAGIHTDRLFPVDGLHQREGAVFGESFAGQILSRQPNSANVPHDLVTGRPAAPLDVVPGTTGRNLAIAPRDPHFGRAVLLPTGPGGPEQNVHGEGALAILFDEDQCQFGIRLFQDGDPVGGSGLPGFGIVNVRVFDRDGNLVGQVRRSRQNGIVTLAYERAGGHADIAGLLVQNVDPGGIAIDEIRFAASCTPAVG